MNLEDIIKRPIITEKAVDLQEKDKYVFEVNRRANKQQIKEAVEKLFNVAVEDVHTMVVRGKVYRRGRLRRPTQKSNWKKAIVTLAEGESIDYTG